MFKKKDASKKQIATAVGVGTVVGVGVGIAATKALSDTKTRKMLAAKVSDMKDTVIEAVDRVRGGVAETKDIIEEKLSEDDTNGAKKSTPKNIPVKAK